MPCMRPSIVGATKCVSWGAFKQHRTVAALLSLARTGWCMRHFERSVQIHHKLSALRLTQVLLSTMERFNDTLQCPGSNRFSRTDRQ
jgi:hypothetical protein